MTVVFTDIYTTNAEGLMEWCYRVRWLVSVELKSPKVVATQSNLDLPLKHSSVRTLLAACRVTAPLQTSIAYK